MSYIGKVDMNDANIKHYSLTSSTLTVIPIGWVPASEQSLRVTINGVVQQGDTFSYSGSNLTLGGPLVVTDTLEVVGIESVGNIITPADNSVTTTKLADDAVTLAKMADGTQGDTLYYGAAGAPTLLAKPGTPADEVLTFATGASAPSWAAGVADGGVTVAKLSASATEADNVKQRVAKAWVNFKGDGTVAILDDFNVSSITDNGVGQFTITFTVAMSNVNYAVAATIGNSTKGVIACDGLATTSFNVNAREANTATLTDYGSNCATVFGDTA